MTDSPPSRPVRQAGVRAYHMGRESLLYVADAETAHALNTSAMAIWELCDGTRTAEQIAEELGRWLDRPAETLLDDVEHGLSQLASLKLVRLT